MNGSSDKRKTLTDTVINPWTVDKIIKLKKIPTIVYSGQNLYNIGQSNEL
jgi:hypothetical protein